jgi:MscS family membrane protein
MLILSAVLFHGAALAQAPTLKDVIEQEEAAQASEAEQDAKAKKAAASARPGDELGRETPRAAVLGYFRAVNAADWEQATEYLDLRNLPGGLSDADGPELARKLKVVLDRTLWVDIEALSTDPKGHSDDGVASYRDWVGRLKLDDEQIDILLQRVPDGSGGRIWKISNKTVGDIPRLYESYGYGPIGEWLYQLLPEYEFLGLQTWQWVMLAGLFAFGYAIALVLTWLLAFMIRRSQSALREELSGFTTGPIRFLIMVLFVRALFDTISPSVTALAIAEGQTLLTIVMTWVVISIVEIIRRNLANRMEARGAHQAKVLLRPAATAVKILIVVIAGMIWLENLGFKATTLLAGLGIGGLAVALAAQKSVENIIGAITLYAASPVRVGDFCRYGDKLGLIDEIGLRYSRIRTLDRTVVTVPNAALAEMHLENFMERDKVWFHPQIRLRYDTTPDQIRYVLVEVRKMLYAHPKVDPDPARIRFSGFGEHSLDLDIFAYIPTRDFDEYLEVAEDINLRIMDIVAQAGCVLAVPTQTLWMERGQRPDRDAAHAAEQTVEQWRNDDELCLPRFPQVKIDELRGSLRYPPEGSAMSKQST